MAQADPERYRALQLRRKELQASLASAGIQ
jgi:hypothetical protein